LDLQEELSSQVSGGARVIVIAERDVDLRATAGDNRIFLLRIAEGSLASGGRGGGFGERRVVSVGYFVRAGGAWSKPFYTQDEAKLSGFEVPYYVSRLPMTLSDGTEAMGYGVVDAELVEEFARKASGSSA
jgi:hypothetical protein